MPSFAISKFIILLEPLWVSAVFLLLSTGPYIFLIFLDNFQVFLDFERRLRVPKMPKPIQAQTMN